MTRRHKFNNTRDVSPLYATQMSSSSLRITLIEVGVQFSVQLSRDRDLQLEALPFGPTDELQSVPSVGPIAPQMRQNLRRRR